jgi:hypothetical protein
MITAFGFLALVLEGRNEFYDFVDLGIVDLFGHAGTGAALSGAGIFQPVTGRVILKNGQLVVPTPQKRHANNLD